MATIETLTVKISADTSGLERGMAKAGSSVAGFGSKVSAGSSNAAEKARQMAKKMADAMERQFRVDMARIKEGQARGFLKPAEARKAGAEAAAAYNAGMVRILDRTARAPGGLQSAAGKETYTKLAGSLKVVQGASQGATRGFGELRESAASMAAQMAGAHPIAGRLSNVIGGFALSSGVMVGVLGGVAALGFAWNKLTEDAKKLKAETDESLKSLREMRLEAETMGDITIINKLKPAQARRDRIVSERKEIEGRIAPGRTVEDLKRDRLSAIAMGNPTVAIALTQQIADVEKLVELKKEEAELVREISFGEAELAKNRRARVAATAGGTGGTGSGSTADATNAMKQYNTTLAEGVSLGIASNKEVAELRAKAYELLTASMDANKPLKERIELLKEARDLNKVIIDDLRTSVRMTAEQINRLRLPGAGTVLAPNAPKAMPAPPSSEQPAPGKVQMLEQNARLGPAGQELMQVAQAAAAGLGPFALLIPVINSALEALEPFLAAIIEPLARIGTLVAQQLSPSLELLGHMLKGVTIAVSYLHEAIGWIVEGIAKVINKLLPGNPLRNMERFGREMQEAARAARDFTSSTNEVVKEFAATMRNVPISFNLGHARYRVGMGSTGMGGNAAGGARSSRSVTNITMNITQQAGESGEVFAKRVIAAINKEANNGDGFARALTRVR